MNRRFKGWVLGLLALVLGVGSGTGCGAKDDPVPSVTGGGSAPTTELAAVDPANEASYRAWLKANEVEAPEVSMSGTRSGGGDTPGWPLLPRGDVRLEGLNVWRIEVDAMSFEPEAGGVLEFRKGKNVLWRDSVPFSPASRIVQGGLPKSVLDAVKVGDTVSWGVVYDKQPKKSLLAEFKVVNKPSAAKQIDRLENDRQNARQPAKVKSLGRNQALLNNSLFAEALRGYMDLAVGEANDPVVQEACYRIVECLRRLGLDESLLYADAVALAANKKGKGGKPSDDPGVGAGGAAGAGLASAGDYVPTGASPLPEPTPPEPVPPTPPGTTPERTKPTDPATRRAVEAVENDAHRRFAEAEAMARQEADQAAGAEAKAAILRSALAAATGTPDEAQARAALVEAEAVLARDKAEAEAAQAGQAAAAHDQSMIEKLREMAQAGPHKNEPGKADANWKGMADRAKNADTEADARQAKAAQLDMLADKAEAEGKSDAADMRAKADEAALAAAAARLKADDAQQRVEKAFLALPPTPQGPGAGPTDAEKVGALTGWAERLRAAEAALREKVVAKGKQADDADAAGNAAEAATLRAEAKDAAKAAQQANERATAAEEALKVLLSTLGPTAPGG